jgi:hypothetical protein
VSAACPWADTEEFSLPRDKIKFIASFVVQINQDARMTTKKFF